MVPLQQKQQHKCKKGNNTTMGRQHHQCKQTTVPMWESNTTNAGRHHQHQHGKATPPLMWEGNSTNAKR
jgi:hypothetical protein